MVIELAALNMYANIMYPSRPKDLSGNLAPAVAVVCPNLAVVCKAAFDLDLRPKSNHQSSNENNPKHKKKFNKLGYLLVSNQA